MLNFRFWLEIISGAILHLTRSPSLFFFFGRNKLEGQDITSSQKRYFLSSRSKVHLEEKPRKSNIKTIYGKNISKKFNIFFDKIMFLKFSVSGFTCYGPFWVFPPRLRPVCLLGHKSESKFKVQTKWDQYVSIIQIYCILTIEHFKNIIARHLCY